MDFINDYLEFNKGNEAHKNYHLWSAFSILASAASRKIWVKQGYFVISPNMYIGLIGPSGGRKTTAKNEAYSMLYSALKDFIPISAESMSKEAITQFLGQDAQQRAYLDQETGEKIIYTPFSIFATEFVQFLSINPIAMSEFLTTIYDMQFYEVRTKNKGTDIIQKPFINLLVCDTPENITFRLRTRTMSAGFARRFIPIYESENAPPIPRPKIAPESKLALLRCITHLQKVWSTSGPMIWEPEAESFFDAWYCKNYDVKHQNSLMQAYLRCKADLVLKVATILACAQYDIKLVLTRDLLFRSMCYLEKIEPGILRLYEGFGDNKLAQPGEKILECVKGMGGLVLKSKLKSLMWGNLDNKDFDEVLKHYVDSGDLFEVTATDKTTGNRFPHVCSKEKYEELKKNQGG